MQVVVILPHGIQWPTCSTHCIPYPREARASVTIFFFRNIPVSTLEGQFKDWIIPQTAFRYTFFKTNVSKFGSKLRNYVAKNTIGNQSSLFSTGFMPNQWYVMSCLIPTLDKILSFLLLLLLLVLLDQAITWKNVNPNASLPFFIFFHNVKMKTSSAKW